MQVVQVGVWCPLRQLVSRTPRPARRRWDRGKGKERKVHTVAPPPPLFDVHLDFSLLEELIALLDSATTDEQTTLQLGQQATQTENAGPFQSSTSLTLQGEESEHEVVAPVEAGVGGGGMATGGVESHNSQQKQHSVSVDPATECVVLGEESEPAIQDTVLGGSTTETAECVALGGSTTDTVECVAGLRDGVTEDTLTEDNGGRTELEPVAPHRSDTIAPLQHSHYTQTLSVQ